jgi:hypothetical protein
MITVIHIATTPPTTPPTMALTGGGCEEISGVLVEEIDAELDEDKDEVVKVVEILVVDVGAGELYPGGYAVPMLMP